MGTEGSDVAASGEVEEADGAVGEAAGKVVVGESEAEANEAIGGPAIAGVILEDGVGAVARAEVGIPPMPEDVFLAPRGLAEVGPAPDSAGYAVPQRVQVGDGSPRGAHLSHQKRHPCNARRNNKRACSQVPLPTTKS